MRFVSGNDDHAFRFVTNHAHVLQVVCADPTARMRDIAEIVGITERTAAQIVSDLEGADYLSKTRDGRRNHYEVHEELPLRRPQHRHHTVGDLIRFLQAPSNPSGQKSKAAARRSTATHTPRQRQ
jgi:hypothetical protein